MTRPTPTQGAQSEAARVPRVSDERLDQLCMPVSETPWTASAVRTRDDRHRVLDVVAADGKGVAYVFYDDQRPEMDRLCRRNHQIIASAPSLATDLRDVRQASRDKDAMIADLERRLAGAEREPTCDAIIESWRFQAETATARADALQARLTEAEQRAATAERRGFEAGALVMREAAAREAFGLSGNGKIAAAISALAPAVPQEGETTP